MNILLAIVVSAVLDSAYMAIGDQMDLRLQATYEPADVAAGDGVKAIQMPLYGQSLTPEIEIVDRTAIDTTILSDGRTQLTQYLTITSFKDSLLYIKGIPFVAGNDTFWSEGISLNVIQPFEIDTTNAITDIKPIAKAPIWVWGIVRWILLGLGILALIAGIYYLMRWIERNRKQEEEPINPELLRPAEEVALEKLDAIKAEKKWQDGKVKEYQTELTDVIREYIGRRFDVRSSEKTSDETLKAMKPLLSEQKDLFERLRKMLTLADLVKFAKWTTTPDENEKSLTTAYEFVKETTHELS
ncbi:MAG: hypothetical protein IJR74_04570 [Paludibacteraceae bacterium]|nr:hypothetical protein [Paludibacteraceae bacterium]